jgi:hypothetical protein
MLFYIVVLEDNRKLTMATCHAIKFMIELRRLSKKIGIYALTPDWCENRKIQNIKY